MKNVFKLFVVVFALVMVVAACGNGGGSTSPIKFSENFESYAVVNPWNPASWSNYGGTSWAIVSDSGNKVLSHVATDGHKIYDGYIGSNYTITTKIKPGNSGTMAGIIARFVDFSNFYALTLEGTSLQLRKFASGTGWPAADVAYTFNTTTYYTIILKANGNIITGTVTDGVTTATLSFDDDGTFHGAALGPGKIGVTELGATGTYYDDIVVTEP
jgi:poly(beta-D-mannuronate) lyase